MAAFPSAITSFPTGNSFPAFPSAVGFPSFSFQSGADQGLQGLAPPVEVPTVTAQWLRNIFSLIPEDGGGQLWSLTDPELTELTRLHYGGEATRPSVLSLDDTEVTMEMLGFLRKTPITQIIAEVKQCRDRSDLLWLASQHRDGFLAVAREVFILQVEESDIKGLVKCRRCQSSNVLMMSKQLRAGDEPTTIFTRCVDCKETWKQ